MVRHRRGVALLLALLVLTILILLVGQLVILTSHNRSIADNAVADLQNSYGVKSGYAVALQYLIADGEKAPDVDTVNEKWRNVPGVAAGPASVTVKVEDCESKINLAMMVDDKGVENARVSGMVRRLLKLLDHDPEMADRILDYQDKDAKGDFESGATNQRLLSLDELQRVEGLQREVLFGDENRKGILPFVTVFPRAQGTPMGGGASMVGKINVNTAPAEVLQSLDDGITPKIAGAILQRRGQQSGDGSYQHFTAINDLKEIDGITDELYAKIQDLLVVRASAFEIHLRSKVGAVEKPWVYVVSRAVTPPGPTGGDGKTEFSLIASMRENDFLSLKAPDVKEE
jgi:type II secretory pathway component PulK